MTLLTKEQINRERLSSMAGTFARADSILIGRQITCKVVSEPHVQAPGYSTGNDIFLNQDYIGDVQTTDDIVKVTGLNFHELAHCWFTPSSTTSVARSIHERGLDYYFNMLEDQRIETIMSALYPALKPYFVMTITKYIASSQRSFGSAHALTYGRRFLPDKIRALLREKYEKQSHIDELEHVIDEYRKVVFPKDSDRALVLVQRYAKLLSELGAPPQGDPHGHSTATRPADGSRPDVEQQEKAMKKIAQGEDQAKDEDQYEDQSDSDSGDAGEDGEQDQDGDGDGDAQGDDGDGSGDGSGSGSGDGEEEGDGEGSGDGTGSADDGTDGEGGDPDDEGGTGRGIGSSGSGLPAVTDKELQDILQKVADSALKRPDVQADAKIKEAAISNTAGRIPHLKKDDYREVNVLPEYMFASLGFAKELRKLWEDSDPGWHHETPTGRLNIGRAMRGGDIGTLFDQWNEGKQDTTSVEVVMLVDYSGSMHGSMSSACQALWAVKKAVESIDGEVTVIGFNTRAATFYDKDERVHPQKFRMFGATGGTSPRGAIEQARMIMHYSKKKHRVLFFVTDGGWSGSEQADRAIQEFHQHGVMTALAFIGNWPDLSYWDQQAREEYEQSLLHGVQMHSICNDPSGLVDLAKQIVKKAMLSN